MNKTSEILKQVLINATPPKSETDEINNFLKKFIPDLERELNKLKIDAEVFVGGSFAKKTLIKKGQYDVDLFVRFDEKYKGQDISKFAEKAIHGIKNCKFLTVHGSRNYFKIEVSPLFFVEVVPVLKIKKPKDAENVTDLSYFHVNYIKKKMKTASMLNEVRLAKAFCHANKCYGAESYVNGFSGYAIELLIYNYKTFMNFIKKAVKTENKEIIDIEKLYKNKQEVVMNMNSAKMTSPIVLIDPTYRERNALAALSDETFRNFKESCKKFLEKPSADFFKIKEYNLEKIKKDALKKKASFVLIKLTTDKQEGDIAGTKLLKFYKHLIEELGKFYLISNKGFDYDGEKSAHAFFAVKSRGKIVMNGPSVSDKKNSAIFKKRHKKVFEKKGKLYAEEKIENSVDKFIKDWKAKNSEKIREMSIEQLEVED